MRYHAENRLQRDAPPPSAEAVLRPASGGTVAPGAHLDLQLPAASSAERGRRPVTMRDVAAAAGVSVSAVSYVLNNTRPVRAEKRARVLQAMADLEYVPNGMAQGLRRTRSGLLGVILPDLSMPPYGLFAKHIEAAAREAGYMTVVCNSAGDEDALTTAYMQRLQGLRADGLILRTTREQHELLPAVVQARIPAVLLMSDPPTIGRDLDRVLIDNALGVRLAVRELAQAGHRRIGLVSTQDLSRPTLVRLQGFLQGMGEAGLHADMSYVRIGAASADVGEALAGELLDRPGAPDLADRGPRPPVDRRAAGAPGARHPRAGRPVDRRLRPPRAVRALPDRPDGGRPPPAGDGRNGGAAARRSAGGRPRR
jgi:DNA-binding LacI/PurR family transcriptional regulator